MLGSKYLPFAAGLLLIGLLGSVPRAEAHFLKTDGNIGVVLHIDPDDDPIIGQPASFFFEIKDKSGAFRQSDCDCQVVIKEEGRQLAAEPIAQADLTTASFQYTLPKADVYQVKLTGKPLSTSAFQAFDITWDVRADRTTTTNPLSVARRSIQAHGIHALLLGIAPVTAIILIEIQRRRTPART